MIEYRAAVSIVRISLSNPYLRELYGGKSLFKELQDLFFWSWESCNPLQPVKSSPKFRSVVADCWKLTDDTLEKFLFVEKKFVILQFYLIIIFFDTKTLVIIEIHEIINLTWNFS